MSWLEHFLSRFRWHYADVERRHDGAEEAAARFAMNRDGDLNPANDNDMKLVDEEDLRWRRLQAIERIEKRAIRIYEQERLFDCDGPGEDGEP